MNNRPADKLAICCAQLNSTVGDIAGNAGKVRRARDIASANLTWAPGAAPFSATLTVRYNGGSNSNEVSMGSNHPGGCAVSMADASVRFLSADIDLNTVLLPLASRAGSEADRSN